MGRQKHPYYESAARARISVIQVDTGVGGEELWAYRSITMRPDDLCRPLLPLSPAERRASPLYPLPADGMVHRRELAVSAMYGRRPRCKRNLTFQRRVRVQPCIRPLDAAAMAAGPDVIR